MGSGHSDDRDRLRRCRLLVHRLDESVGVPSPFSLTAFLERWSRHRARKPITLLPLHVRDLPGTCGLLLALGDRYVIGYPASFPRHHRDHVILHEVGHIVAGHGSGSPASHLTSGLLSDLDPAMVRTVLGRSVYHRVEEYEAELIASLIMERALVPAEAGGDEGGMDDVVLERLIRMMGTAGSARVSAGSAVPGSVRRGESPDDG